MVFEAVYVDTKAKEIIAYRPQEPYRALFRLCDGLREEAGMLLTDRYKQLAGFGEPNRIIARTFSYTFEYVAWPRLQVAAHSGGQPDAKCPRETDPEKWTSS